MKALKIAIRSLLHFKSYTLVNVLGLAISLACVIIIFRYVYGELTVDSHIPDLDRTFIVVEEGGIGAGGALSTPGMYSQMARMAYPTDNDLLRKVNAGLSAMASYPGFEKIAHLGANKLEFVVDENHYEAIHMNVTGAFPEIFDIKMLAGVLESPDGGIAISDKFARKVFGAKDPLGKTISRPMFDRAITVIGIFETPQSKTTFPADIISYIQGLGGVTPIVVLPYGADYKKVNAEFREYFDNYYENSGRPEPVKPFLKLIPLGDLYFNKVYDNHSSEIIHNHGNRTNVTLLLTVGILLLLVGVVNFINIYTMVASRRGRELGMKKVFGAGSWAIFIQIWVENLLLVGFSLILALSLIELTSPLVRNLLGLEQIPFIRFDYMLAGIMLVALPLVTTLFPYFRYRYSTPITSLRSVGKTGGGGTLRKIFLAFQYVITLVMITMSLFFLLQLNNMLAVKPGFETKDIIKVGPYRSLVFSNESNAMIINIINSSPLFESWAIGPSPVNPEHKYAKYRLPGGDFIIAKTVYGVTPRWLEFLGISDYKEMAPIIGEGGKILYYKNGFIATEQFIRRFRITNWRDTRLESESINEVGDNYSFPLDGICGEFNGFHIGENFDPVLFVTNYAESLASHPLMLKIAPGKRQEAIKWLEELHGSITRESFKYSFIEEEYAALYDEDIKVATIYGIFTLIAIIVSMMGLFSMSLFDVQQRFNEIAIRKVNGATTGDIIVMLLRKYVVLLGVAFMISIPVSWFILTRYLQTYAFRTPIHWWLFAGALILTAGVSLLTLIVQTKKAAETNPATVIRNE